MAVNARVIDVGRSDMAVNRCYFLLERRIELTEISGHQNEDGTFGFCLVT